MSDEEKWRQIEREKGGEKERHVKERNETNRRMKERQKGRER